MKITESELKSLIEKNISLMLEYRGSEGFGNYEPDGDVSYNASDDDATMRKIRKGGKGMNYVDFVDSKRRKTNLHVPGLRGMSTYSSNPYIHGKGDLISKLADSYQKACEEMFTENDKVEWTDDEKAAITDITYKILDIAGKTKFNGNKKRGYHGKKEKDND